MKMSKMATLVLFVCSFALVAPTVSGGQLGGLIRRGVEGAAKKEEPRKEETRKVRPDGGIEGVDQPRGPDDLPLTDANITRLLKGLDVEIALREELRKELAAVKTPEQYQACTSQLAGGPEYQKISMGILNLPENATQEQLMKVMADMGKQTEALLLKNCGADPTVIRNRMGDRLQDIERQAAAAAR